MLYGAMYTIPDDSQKALMCATLCSWSTWGKALKRCSSCPAVPNIIIISVRGATCCIWARVAGPGAEEITATAGHWPLDWYYRCNIVNNVPLSSLSLRARDCVYVRTESWYLALLDRPTRVLGSTLCLDPLQA